MKKLKKYFTKHNIMLGAVANFALVFSILAANSRCCYIYHQPKAPEELNELKKY